jgi:AcrR family transcriptional regulator
MGYTVGTLYLIFNNLNDLIYAVNAQTVAKMRLQMEQATAGLADPAERLRAMAHSYLAFALANPNLWRLAFEHQMPEGEAIPELIIAETDQVLMAALDTFKQFLPELNNEALTIIAAAFWSAIHGVCHLAVTDTLKVAHIDAERLVLNCLVNSFIGGIVDEHGA